MLGHDAQTGNARQGAALSRWGPPWLPPTRCHHHCWCCRLRHCHTTRHYSSLALGKAWLPAYNGRGRGEPPRHQSSHCCSPSSLRVRPILWPTQPVHLPALPSNAYSSRTCILHGKSRACYELQTHREPLHLSMYFCYYDVSLCFWYIVVNLLSWTTIAWYELGLYAFVLK